ncbi:MAG: hypothetical protein AB2L18_04340 [Anaerolineaceae bacterium]
MGKEKLIKLLRLFLFVFFAIGLFILILLLRIPTGFRPAIIQMRYGFTIPIPIIFILISVILSKDRWNNTAALFILITAVFAMALAGVWASGQTEGQVISGILPDTDAAFYYYDGLRYINGFQFSFFGARRIFFPAFLGILLAITENGTQITLGIITFLLGVSCFYSTLAVWKRFGSIAASLFFVLIFSFARLSVGEMMSESLGLILGCFSFYFFLTYLAQEKTKFLLLAGISLVLGLITRAGPVGIFPLLMLGIFLMRKDKASLKKVLSISLVSIIIVIISFISISSNLSPEGSIPFANFAHSFYGIANGGTGWTSIYSDHPEIETLHEPELTKTILAYSLSAIKDNPFNLVRGIFSQYPQIINFPDHKGFFSFFGGENKVIFYLAQFIVFGLSFFAIYILIKKDKFKKYKFFLYGLLGILITVPLFPFSDFKEMRVYATVIPYLIIFPTIGLSAILDRSPFAKTNHLSRENNNTLIPTFITTSLLICTMIIPLLVWKLIPDQDWQINNECQPGDPEMIVEVNKGSYFGLLKESDLYLDWLPYFHESRFRKNLHNLPYKTVEAFENVTAPSFITSTIDLQSGQAAILIFSDDEYLKQNSILLICGYWDDYDYSSTNANIFFVENAFKID